MTGDLHREQDEKTLPCDGNSISRATYADLFRMIGTTYGADDDTSFRLPDLRDGEWRIET